MADGIKVDVLGAQLIEKKLQRLVTSNKGAVEASMNHASADLLQRSADLAPILTGDLIRSGRVLKTGSNAKTIVRVVGYGTNHAVFAHEMITPAGPFNLGPISSKKPPSPDGPVGGKFLLRPYLLHKHRYIDLVASSLENATVGIVKS